MFRIACLFHRYILRIVLNAFIIVYLIFFFMRVIGQKKNVSIKFTSLQHLQVTLTSNTFASQILRSHLRRDFATSLSRNQITWIQLIAHRYTTVDRSDLTRSSTVHPRYVVNHVVNVMYVETAHCLPPAIRSMPDWT